MKINYKQLAFILDIEPVEALQKIIAVQCKLTGKVPPRAGERAKAYIQDGWPEGLDIGILSVHLNLPTLQSMVEDIQNNYLNRTATKKWILCDYPERELKRCYDNDRPYRIPFPKALESLLPIETSAVIREEWRKRFPNARVV